MNEIVAEGAFLSKVHPPIYAIVHAVMLSKKHQRSCTVQEEGLTNEGKHHLYNQAHDKRGIAESLHVRQFLHTASDQKPEPGKAWERG